MSQALLVGSEPQRPYSAVPVGGRVSSAVSEESRVVRAAMQGLVDSVERSEALFGRRAAIIAQIWALVNECAHEGWDGEGAAPVDRFAAFAAADFIRALPDGILLPEVAPEPDGSISLDWIPSRNSMLSLSVGPSDRLGFGWVDGSDRGHGVVRFDGERIPVRILQGIELTTRHGDSPLGLA